MSDQTGTRVSRLAFIDGLRGIAALIVAVGHVAGMVPPDHPRTDLLHAPARELALWPFLFGAQMVWLFIMLSGFALYFSEDARQRRGRSATVPRVFAARRAWRILPTYYVAVALGLVLLTALPRAHPSPSLNTSEPVTTSGVLSHLLLVHNLSSGWTFQINPPLWSIALEAQLYLAFPLILLGLRRWNPWLTVVLAIVAVKAINATGLPLMGLMPWFAVGALLAHIATHRDRLPVRPLIAAGLTGVAVGLLRLQPVHGQFEQVLWLLAFGCLLLGLSRVRPGGWNAPTWQPVRALGDRSYSLYVLHFPLALAVWFAVDRSGLHGAGAVVAMLLAGGALIAVVTEVSYRLVEEPARARSARAGSRRRQQGAPVPPEESLPSAAAP